MAKQPHVAFISHGGGPLPLLGDVAHAQLVTYLQKLSRELPKPRAILVISAHWEAPVFTVSSGALPGLAYDYYGFPAAAYQIRYPCAGEPSLAHQVADALQAFGLEVALDDERRLDHGVFVPLKIMYPNANIPVVQLSLKQGLDTAAHLALGEALQGLNYDGLLVLGSGFSFHNMREFFNSDPEAEQKNRAFADWLKQVCTNTQLTARERQEQWLQWQQAPQARFCHPREEHLLPLLSCTALAGRAADRYSEVSILNKTAAMLEWHVP
ncbi:DODA-type extradiol aromatic ring-opening family dioxygenase [Gilvimarinus xylanilyticus]|uniref:Dioxygenase n=1 Tax=Gilvimarinus xylanilyticus TaxID=2944139 RepID=A0A9X2KRZ6_9GAMM|nr:class III extradiol ring-cleavage dioxygenase [Gilvimarinus xylanilyticus]MCP8897689.1 dioxygenase [Gilvimarinus xylanilyticus]